MISDTKWANVQHVKGLHARSPRLGGPRSARYEGYGPGAAVVLIECLTDDRERTRRLLRRTFSEHGGQLGAEGSVGYLFDRVGLLRYPPGTDLRRLTQAALSSGAEDVIGQPDRTEVLTDPEDFEAVCAELRRQGLAPLTAEVTERAALAAPLSGEAAQRMAHLIEALADLDDVCNVYTNAQLNGPDPSSA